MKNKFALGLVLAAGMILSSNTAAYAAEVAVDGDYSEWNKDEIANSTGDFFEKVDVRIKDNILYIYAKENAVNDWENYFSYCNPMITHKTVDEATGEEIVKTESLVVLKDGSENSKLVVNNRNGNVCVEGAKGIRTKDDKYEWELAIPLHKYGHVEHVKMCMNYNGLHETFIPGKFDDHHKKEEETSKIEEQPTTAPSEDVEDVTTAANGIVIDGEFKDWEPYPHSYVINWDMPNEWRNENNCRTAALVMDEEYVYFHIRMRGDGNETYNGNQYELVSGDYVVELFVFGENNEVLSDGSFEPGKHKVIVRYKPGIAEDLNLVEVEGSEAILTVTEGAPDELEWKVPLEIFDIVHGVVDIKEVTLYNPSVLGTGASGGGITVAGSSTGGVLGIAICLVSVGAGSLIYKKKRTVKEK